MPKSVIDFLKKNLSIIIDVICPKCCLICGMDIEFCQKKSITIDTFFCKECRRDIFTINQNNCCKKCGYPFEPIRTNKGRAIRSVNNLKNQKIICQSCHTMHFFFEKAQSCFQYQGKIRKLLLNFKFYFQTEIVDFIGTSLMSVYKNTTPADIVCVVPITRSKLFFKGYNHSALIAKAFYKYAKRQNTNILFLPDLLVKTKASTQSKTLTQQERWLKKHNFTINEKYLTDKWKAKLQNQTILIIDDIMTTGSTLNSASFVLKQNFYNTKINCLTFARTMLY